MAFVGQVFVPPPPASERVRRLSAELQKTIVEFQRREPGVSARDIRHALFMARRSADAGRPARLVAVVAGAAVALIVGLLLSARDATTAPVPWAPLAVLVVLGAVALTLYLRRRE